MIAKIIKLRINKKLTTQMIGLTSLALPVTTFVIAKKMKPAAIPYEENLKNYIFVLII
jgi:hypothetical protein